MEWAELLTGVIGGGLGGTILGRLWDNRREDRFRHIEVKREVVGQYVGTLATLTATLKLLNSHREKLRTNPGSESWREQVDRRVAECLQLRDSLVPLEGQLSLLFGADVNDARRELADLTKAMFIGDGDQGSLLEQYRTTYEALVTAAQRELGVRPTG